MIRVGQPRDKRNMGEAFGYGYHFVHFLSIPILGRGQESTELRCPLPLRAGYPTACKSDTTILMEKVPV